MQLSAKPSGSVTFTRPTSKSEDEGRRASGYMWQARARPGIAVRPKMIGGTRNEGSNDKRTKRGSFGERNVEGELGRKKTPNEQVRTEHEMTRVPGAGTASCGKRGGVLKSDRGGTASSRNSSGPHVHERRKGWWRFESRETGRRELFSVKWCQGSRDSWRDSGWFVWISPT